MKNRFYAREQDIWEGDFNTLIFLDGRKIDYSFWCSSPEHFPPEDYELVFECENMEEIHIEYGPVNQTLMEEYWRFGD